MSVIRLNPDTLHQSPVFTQVVTVSNPAKLVYVGGQNGVDVQGKIVGKDIASQSEQTFKNVIAALEAAGATISIHHEKLENGEQREAMRTHWSAVLDKLGALM